MQDIQAIFIRIEEAKKKLKDLKSVYKDALSASQEYEEIKEQLKTFREKKKSIETAVKEQFSAEIIQMEDLKIDIASDQELLSDVAMTKFMKGETVEVSDKHENQYEPIFKVTFKKVS